MEPELPQEMLVEIFSRLPTKSVGRCRCLSKPWRRLLSTPEFIKTHLSRMPYQENLMIVTPSHSINSISKTGHSNVSKRVELGDNWTEFVGSCDGLVLLIDARAEIFLVNPTTLEELKIPESPQALKRNEGSRMYGFGYDSSTDDYKVVTLSYYIPDEEYDGDTFVDVYSVKNGDWKRVGTSPYNHVLPEIHSGAFVNGALHWLAGTKDPDHPSVVAVFDLAEEVFRELPSPPGVDAEMFVFIDVVALGGRLGVVDPRSSNGTDVWIMMEYGLADSWLNFSVAEDMAKPLCFTGYEMVLVTEMDTLVVYNPVEGTLNIMLVDGAEALGVVIDGGTFLETLVPPTPSLGLADMDV